MFYVLFKNCQNCYVKGVCRSASSKNMFGKLKTGIKISAGQAVLKLWITNVCTFRQITTEPWDLLTNLIPFLSSSDNFLYDA